MPDDAIERARECLADTISEPSCSSPPVDATLVRYGATATVMIAADDVLEAMIAFASQQAPEGWRSISHELALAAGNLVVATDGIETLRDKRQLVLDRLNNLAAMLDAQPPTKEPTP